MEPLQILTIPDDRLKQPSEPVTSFDDELRDFVAELELARQQGPAAVGIAAPQVGVLRRIAIVDCSNTRKPVSNHGNLVLINPEITHWDGYEVGREGCLSVPDYTGNVIRATRIRLKAMDEQGDEREFEMEGYEARAVQHEIDHLDGILFIDRVVSRRTDLFKRKVYR
ncbi:peptide deformylase [Thiolapillus sp.]